jgi:hypothetical protein
VQFLSEEYKSFDVAEPYSPCGPATIWEVHEFPAGDIGQFSPLLCTFEPIDFYGDVLNGVGTTRPQSADFDLEPGQ